MLLLFSLLSAEEVVFRYTADNLYYFNASEDGSSWGFAARKAGKEYVIINSQEWGPYDDATGPRFPKDGSVIFYCARKTGGQWEIIKVTS